jgi:DNA adenine methylase
MPGYLDGYRERIAAAAVRLMGVSLECRPALDVIADYGRSPRVLLYVDPPYLGNTRSSAGYRQEMPGEDAHRALAEALHTVRAAVVLSGYDSALYSDFYDGWHRVTRPTRTGNGGEHKARTEVVWSNRPMHEQHTFFDLSDPRSAT